MSEASQPLAIPARDAGHQHADADTPEDASAPAEIEEPRLGAFSAPETCAPCHPDHVREWSMSPHAYAMVDPVFRAMVRLGQDETAGALGQFCVRCHSPFAVATQQTSYGPIAMAGVSCDVCHTAGAAVVGAGGPELALGATRRAGISDPVPNAFHPSEHGPLQQTATLCGSCHDVISELGPVPLRVESTFSEWLPVLHSGTCQECHMPTRRGQAAVDGPERLVHDHRFVGPDVSLLPAEEFPGYVEMRQAAQEFLAERSVEMTAIYGARDQTLEIHLENQAGHALPTGATADRQLWLEVRVRDAASEREVFSSGTLDERGDLRPDPQLQLFHQRLLGEGGEVDFVWQASGFEERLIGALERITLRYDLSALSPGRYRATVRLRLRAFPPYLLRKLVEQAGLDEAVVERLPIVDLAARELDVEL